MALRQHSAVVLIFGFVLVRFSLIVRAPQLKRQARAISSRVNAKYSASTSGEAPAVTFSALSSLLLEGYEM